MSIRPDPKPVPEPRIPRTVKRRPSPRLWASSGPAGTGICTYCGEWRKLTWDHVLPRSRYHGEDRNTPVNLLRVCWDCNRDRPYGFKPMWDTIPAETQAFVLERIGALSAMTLFEGVPQT